MGPARPVDGTPERQRAKSGPADSLLKVRTAASTRSVWNSASDCPAGIPDRRDVDNRGGDWDHGPVTDDNQSCCDWRYSTLSELDRDWSRTLGFDRYGHVRA
jgi:hypothetical protein